MARLDNVRRAFGRSFGPQGREFHQARPGGKEEEIARQDPSGLPEQFSNKNVLYSSTAYRPTEWKVCYLSQLLFLVNRQ
jgi:hypothetical protein